MIVLDTNVISETMRGKPDRLLVTWLDDQPPADFYLCAPVLAELFYVIARLHTSARKDELARLVKDMIQNIFNGRILAFDSAAAGRYGEIVAGREASGRPISVIDVMIAAITQSNNATLATRNISDFELTGVTLVNPFSEPAAP